MCDTMWKDGIFAKNSDRSCNEPNLVQYFPGGATDSPIVKCTYIEISEVSKKNAILLVRPSWMWGAEMGINEHALIIGNEAVFTKSKGKKTERLLGMDMLRLALERAETADEGVEVLVELLKEYGQGGNCGFDKNFYYDNSFLLADKTKAYIMETAGYEYKVKQLKGYGNISNRLSIEEDDFAKKHTNKLITHFAGALKRQNSGTCSIKDANNVIDAFSALRTHDVKDRKKLYSKGSVSSVCMHQSLLGDHTTGSMVVDNRGENPVIWITGASTPCLSIFKPVLFGEYIPPVFVGERESLEYWLKREYLNRAIFAGAIDVDTHIERAREIELSFVKEYQELLDGKADAKALTAFVKECSRKEEEFIDGYREIIQDNKNQLIKLPRLWEKKTKSLGENVFRN